MSVPQDRRGTSFQRSLGLQYHPIDGTSDGVLVELPIRDDLRGPAGSLEGGVISTIIDCAGAAAVARQLGNLVATQQMSISFLAPGRLGPVRAAATPLRIASDHGVAEVRVVDSGHDDRLMAVALVTVRALSRRPEGAG